MGNTDRWRTSLGFRIIDKNDELNLNASSNDPTCAALCLKQRRYLSACPTWLEWPFFMSARLHTRAHTLWPLPVSSPTLVLLLCSLYSNHVRPGPCGWPSKERLITGRRVLFVSQFSFQGSLPSSLSLFLSALLMFASHSSSCLYFLLSAFFFLPRLLPLGWILKARSSTKVQISFVWIVWLWPQTCPCCWATSWAVGKCVWIPRQQLVTWKCTQWVGVGVGLGRFAGRKEGGRLVVPCLSPECLIIAATVEPSSF